MRRPPTLEMTHDLSILLFIAIHPRPLFNLRGDFKLRNEWIFNWDGFLDSKNITELEERLSLIEVLPFLIIGLQEDESFFGDW